MKHILFHWILGLRSFMKKFFKWSFILLFIAIIIFVSIFHKRLVLTYRLAEKYISLKNNIATNHEFDVITTANSMNHKDIIYKDTNGVPLTLDIYSPQNKVYKSSPVILYVHGGSYVYGDKSIPDTISPILDAFRDEGYTIISTSYELMKDTANFNKQVADIKDTIRWINKNKSYYNFDTDEIGILGISSGAHLSLLASYSDNESFIDDKELSNYPSKVKYLIDFAGPTDLSLLNTENLNYDLTKIFNSIRNKETMTKKFNPINYVNKDIPNTLIIHSLQDATVPFESSQKLYDECVKQDGKASLITLNSSAHDLSSISNKDITSISTGLLKFIVFNSPL